MTEQLPISPELSRALNHVKAQRALLVADWQREIRSIEEKGEFRLKPQALTSPGAILAGTCTRVTSYLARQVTQTTHLIPFWLDTVDEVSINSGHTLLGLQDPSTQLVVGFDAMPQQTVSYGNGNFDQTLSFGPFSSLDTLTIYLGKTYQTGEASQSRWKVFTEGPFKSLSSEDLWDSIIRVIRENVIEADSLPKAKLYY